MENEFKEKDLKAWRKLRGRPVESSEPETDEEKSLLKRIEKWRFEHGASITNK